MSLRCVNDCMGSRLSIHVQRYASTVHACVKSFKVYCVGARVGQVYHMLCTSGYFGAPGYQGERGVQPSPSAAGPQGEATLRGQGLDLLQGTYMYMACSSWTRAYEYMYCRLYMERSKVYYSVS